MKNQVLVVETKDKLRRDIHAVLKEYDLEPLRADSASEARECLAQAAPLAIVFNAAIDGMRTVLEESRRHSTQRPVVVVCAPQQAQRVMTDLKPLRPHVMVTPLSRALIANTIDHILFAAALQNRLQATTGVETPVNQNESDRIDAERFVAVKQLVDKMSTFIGRIASEAQGGLTFFNQMPYFVAIHNRNGQVLATNPAYTQHLGHHVPGNSWDIYSGKLARANSCPVGQTVASGRILKTRAVVKYQSGVKVPVIVHTAPIFNDAGQIELILEVFAGSKEIDRLAEEITTTQQRYQQLFNAAPNYIIVLDRKLRATAVNQGFKSMFGDLTGRSFYDLFPECSAPTRRCPIALTVEDGMPHQGEMVLSTRKGAQHNLMAWTSPVITPAGKLIQVLAIFADITELRKLQDNLSSLGLMMGTLTHSLKGSLTGLDAGLFLIDSGFYRDKPGQIEEGLDVSKLMVERLRKMVHNVLYYAKERELQTERTSIRHFAGDVAANVEVRIRGAAIQFSTAFAPDLGSFEIDSGLVRAALINILENAMEACLEDARDLPHRIEFNVRPEGQYVVFDISDNGSGMDENQQRQMFDLFYSSKGHQGTGLGLFITNKVIAKHGGSISVDSELGQGTTFHIRLPIKS